MVYKVSDITGMSPWYSGTEREHQQIFKRLIQSGDTVIDIGANWGLHTLYFSRLTGREGFVFAVEPFPTAFTELEWHIHANDCLNVKTISDAISNEDGKALFTLGDSAYTGSLSTVKPDSLAQNKQIPVMTRKLDSLIEEFGIKRLKLVKIDVEGAESKVLFGATKTIEQFNPYFVVDLHTPEQDISVARFLVSCGYKLSRLSGPPISRTDSGWPDTNGVWGTILASPVSH
jgi:FkbM family methyltransferase